MKSKRLMMQAAVAAATATAALSALAQQQGPARAEQAVIEDIVVTARKVEESLMDTPIAVTAFGRDDINRLGVVGPADIGALTPGLLYEKDFGRRFDRPVIRGQSNILGAPNAATFIDGVFIPDSLFSTELAFVERVEVIKGPQSALYGRQTFSGAISYVTRKPSEEHEFGARLRAAEDEEYDVLLTASGPLIKDKLYYQVGANYYTFGGQYDNNAPGFPGDGETLGGEETQAFSGKLLFTPTDQLDITVRMAWSENDDDHETTALQDSTFNNCFLDRARQYYCGDVNVGPEAIGVNLEEVEGGGIGRETFRAALTGEYRFANGYTLTSITGYNDADESRRFDADFQPFFGFIGLLHVNDTVAWESFSQEFRFTSPQDERFRWMVGAYYYDETRDENRFQYQFDRLLDNAENEVENIAVFGSVGYDITDRLTATAELRYAEDELSLVGGDANADLNETFDSTNPRFTLDYQATDDLLLYGVVARGNKPGGFNFDVRLPQGLVAFDEEESWSYELGLKATLLDQRMTVDLAAYYIDWTDQQLTQNFLPAEGSPFSFIDNAGTLDIYGFEAEVTLALTPDWRLRGSYAYTDAEFTGGTDAEFGQLTGNDSLEGQRPPNMADHMASLISDYRFEFGNGYTGFVSADASFRSSKYAQVMNFAESGDRTVVNARVGVERGKYTLMAFVRNVFDNTDPVSITRYIDSRNFVGSPFVTNRGFLAFIPRSRQVGAELRYNF